MEFLPKKTLFFLPKKSKSKSRLFFVVGSYFLLTTFWLCSVLLYKVLISSTKDLCAQRPHCGQKIYWFLLLLVMKTFQSSTKAIQLLLVDFPTTCSSLLAWFHPIQLLELTFSTWLWTWLSWSWHHPQGGDSWFQTTYRNTKLSKFHECHYCWWFRNLANHLGCTKPCK